MISIHEKTIRKKGLTVLVSLLFFLLIYAIVIGAAICIGLASIYVGILILSKPDALGALILAGAFFIFGGFILWFLFLATFRKQKTEKPIMFRATEKRNGRLIQLVNEVAVAVGAKKPKNIFISPNVEANVGFDSPLRSIFYPGAKNLTVGIGLINSTSEHELKAVLAHEFGHFGQKSMRIGSMVYHINQLIFKILNNNTQLDGASSEFSQYAGGRNLLYLGLKGFSSGINWIFSKMWMLINKQNFALMQAMEFHADAVAARYAGPQALIRSLERLPFASSTLHSVIAFYSDRLGENLKSTNIFAEQKWLMGFIAEKVGLNSTHGLPDIGTYPLYEFANRLIVKDQWSSHPTTRDRVTALLQLGFPDPDFGTRPAMEMLDTPELTCQKLTEWFFDHFPFAVPPTLFSLEDFIQAYEKQESAKEFPAVFNSYFNWVTVSTFPSESAKMADLPEDWRSLFDEDKLRMVIELTFLMDEIESLGVIADPKTYFKTFDYDGKRFRKKDANKLKSTLEAKVEHLKAEIDRNNQSIYSFFHSKAGSLGKSKTLEIAYQHYFDIAENWAEKMKTRDKIVKALNYLLASESYLEAMDRSKNMEKWDKALKDILKWILGKPFMLNWLGHSTISTMREFIQHKALYYSDEKINGELVNQVIEILRMFEGFAVADQNSAIHQLANLQYDILEDAGLLED